MNNMHYGNAESEARMDGSRDRWLIDGDCGFCRRQPFCSKPCKLAKGRHQAQVMGVIAQAVAKALLEPKNKE